MRALLRPEVLVVAAALGVVATIVVEKTWRHEGFSLGGLLVARGVLSATAGAASALGFGSPWFQRGATALIWGVVAIALLKGVRDRRFLTAPGQGLWLAAMAYGLGAVTAAIAHGVYPDRIVVLVAGLTAVWFAVDVRPAWAATAGKYVLALFVVGSLAALAVGASGASTPYGSSWIPGMDFRVSGITSHANRLGPLMVLYLILERVQPSRPLLRPFMVSAAVVLLVLSQSKTAWAAALFVVVVHWAGNPARQRTERALAVVFVVALLGLAMGLADPPDEPIVAPGQLETARTLTGRTAVWEFGVETWREDPVWGAGPGVFREYAEVTGREWAGQAHNQYIQTLGEHGVFGGAGLVIYVLVLGVYAVRNASWSGFASVSFTGVFLIRTMTEAALDRLSLEHVLVFALLLAWERSRPDAQSAVSADLARRRTRRLAPPLGAGSSP